MWHQLWAIVKKDWLLERRTRQSTAAMIVFSISAVVTFNFALDADLGAARAVSLGLLWVIIWLAGTLGMNRSFGAETEFSALDALLIAPLDRRALFLGKVISVWLSLSLLEAILIPLFIVFFDKPFYRPLVLLTLALGTLGYVSAGVIVSTMAAQTRSSATLIPILLLPLTLPLVLLASAVSAEFMLPTPQFANVQLPFLFMLLYDFLILSAGYLSYNHLLEE